MAADLASMKEWLHDEVENRTLMLSALKEKGDAAAVQEKAEHLALFQGALAASGSEQSLDAFLASAKGDRVASIQKMWQQFKG